ncbi:MAG: bacteriohopanetetrol glucosamine biosynthesis glycosyltransferase HpnI [Xanthobacteraceae bacterium]
MSFSLGFLAPFLGALSELAAVLAAAGCAYLLIASGIVLRFKLQISSLARTNFEPVSFLKPLCGAEPDLSQRITAFHHQDYDASIQTVCGVHSDSDAALPEILPLIGQHTNMDLVIAAHQRGQNLKVSNLIGMLKHARHDIIVISDGDIEVSADYLKGIMAELNKPGIGAVSCLYHGLATESIWSKQSAFGINSHFLPNSIVALALGLAQPCFGSTIAMRRTMLRSIGGLEAVADVLADDYEIGARVRTAGHGVAFPGFSVGQWCFQNSLREMLSYEVRTARTIRSIDPLGYFGMLLTHPFPLAICGLYAGGMAALITAGIALASRALLCRCVERRFKLAGQPYWLVPFRDVLSFMAYICGLVGSGITWRGSTYVVNWDGSLSLYY